MLTTQVQKLEPHLAQLGVDKTRFIRIVTNELQRNAALAECTAPSLFAAVLRSAELNLEPGPLGLAWFIPRRSNGVNQVTWQLGYKGIVELAARAGITIQTGVVHEGEHFVENLGTNASIEHRPHPNPEGKAIAYYAVATLPDGRKLHRVLSLKEIEERRKVGKTKLEAGKPWHDWPDMMARKTCILAMKGMLPLSAEMKVALQADEQVQTVELSGLKAVPEERALTAGGETVDRATGEIIEAPASGEGERSEAPQAAVVDVTPEPEEPTSEQAPAATPPHEANAAHTDQPAPARPTSDMIAMLERIAAEYGWDEHQTFISFAIDGWDDAALTFDHASAQLHLWASQIESWRRNRRARLASAAESRGVDLPKWLADRKLPLAGEIDARSAQSAIDQIEAMERSPANQPSQAEASSAPAAGSTVTQDPQIRAQFDAALSVLFQGPSARARFRDRFLLSCGVESNDDLTDAQLLAGIAKAKKETA
jgi:recombination protein RecT